MTSDSVDYVPFEATTVAARRAPAPASSSACATSPSSWPSRSAAPR